DGPGQAWVAAADERRWLVTEAPVPATGLTLRLVLSAGDVEGALAGPFQRLVLLVGLSVALVVAGGLVLAWQAARLERTELELARSRDLAAMGQTAAAIAHEVKNALNGLSMAVDLLATGTAARDVLRDVHGRARAEVARLRRVADDLTLFAATPRLATEPIDLARLCQDAAVSVAELAEDHQVRVEVVAPGPIPARGDPARLLGAVVNLARNGIEAMGPGGFGEPLGGAPPGHARELRISARREPGRVVVEVADRGPGLDAEVAQRLFEPFVTTKRTGSGLGLAIVHRVVEAHGGEVAAAAREGGGTVFTLAIPDGQGAEVGA
ncbi:MAG TPA: HAMP domain-containing sensor histidine kinase, partial [Anaeromyxobacteraceae bacterium]|nr:HAMP domain-containing sensor histidine kinase [Anaeromyxobacteraceae bacterium]